MRVEAKEGDQPLWGYSEKIKHQTWVYNLSGWWQYQVGGKRQSRTMCRESLFQMTSEYWTIKFHQHHAVNAFWGDHWTQQHNRYFSFKIRKTSKCPWKLADGPLHSSFVLYWILGVAMPILDPMGERVQKNQVGCIWKNLLVGFASFTFTFTFKFTFTFTFTFTYIHTYILHACMHTYLPTYFPTYIPTYLHTYLPTYIPTYLHTYIPTYLRTHIPTYLHTYLHTYQTYRHTDIHLGIHTYINI